MVLNQEVTDFVRISVEQAGDKPKELADGYRQVLQQFQEKVESPTWGLEEEKRAEIRDRIERLLAIVDDPGMFNTRINGVTTGVYTLSIYEEQFGPDNVDKLDSMQQLHTEYSAKPVSAETSRFRNRLLKIAFNNYVVRRGDRNSGYVGLDQRQDIAPSTDEVDELYKEVSAALADDPSNDELVALNVRLDAMWNAIQPEKVKVRVA